MRSALQLPLPPCTLHVVIQRLLVLFTQPAGHLSALPLRLFSFSKEPAAELIRQAKHTAANRGAITSILTLATRARNLLRKVP